MLLSHGYESVGTEVIDEDSEVVERASHFWEHVEVRVVVSSAIGLSTLGLEGLRREGFIQGCLGRSPWRIFGSSAGRLRCAPGRCSGGRASDGSCRPRPDCS